MRSKTSVALVAVAASVVIGATSPSKPAADARTYVVPLTAGAEVSHAAGTALAGDTDGSGSVRLTVDLASRQICYDFKLSELATPLMAHIHKGQELRNGPSVVTLFTGPGGELTDCLMWTEKWLTEIVSNPSGFYVNVYTTEFPDGALRGQLAG